MISQFFQIVRQYAASKSNIGNGRTRDKAPANRFVVVNALAMVAVAFAVSATPAHAAMITTNEVGVDAIFSQPTFNPPRAPIDIRFNAPIVVNDASLLNITTEAQLNQLFGLNLTPALVISMFFVDTLDFCSNFDVNIVGCAQRPGTNLVVESAAAAGPNGAELNAHEISHNLGLPHFNGEGNLMNDSLNGNTHLNVPQINTLLSSALVQTDTDGSRFVSITPILIAAVPLPAAGLLFFSGLMALVWVRRRKAAQTA